MTIIHLFFRTQEQQQHLSVGLRKLTETRSDVEQLAASLAVRSVEFFAVFSWSLSHNKMFAFFTGAKSWMRRSPLQARSLKAWSSISKRPKKEENEPRSECDLTPNALDVQTTLKCSPEFCF